MGMTSNTSQKSDNQKFQILVIDDRPDDRESLVALLEAHGYQATGLTGGRAALEHLAGHPADLALVDMVMPGMDGLTTLRELKRVAPELDVILITAYATLEKAVAGFQEGAYDFLVKPCPPETIIAALERVREKKRLRQSIREGEERLRQSESFLHSVLETLGDAVVVIGRDLRIISANRGYRLQSTRGEEEIIGQHCYLVSHGYSRPCWLEEDCVCAVTQAIKSGRPHSSVHIHRNKEGVPLYVETNAYPLRDQDGHIYAAVETIRDITEIKELEQEKTAKEVEIHRLAFYDFLTDLPNRRLLLDRLDQAFAASERSGQYGAVIFLDLDNFKNLNDTRGHRTGDLILQMTAQRLQETVRDDDTVARLGGDEFVILLSNLATQSETAISRVGRVAEKIRLALAQPFQLETSKQGGSPGSFESGEFHLGASLGIVLFHGHENSTEELFKYADTAMYRAKEAGRNTARFFDPAMQTALEESETLERDLRRAVVEEQFELYYQPQVDATGRLLGAEALLRWYHPERGPVSPLSFIPVSEENGLILPIGQWVLQEACRQLAAWSQSFPVGDFRLAINVSARQFHQPGFVAEVQEIIASAQVEPRRIKLELTETLVLADLEDTISKMRQLQAVGIGFAMDDFGTGYSSLAKLKQLPLEQLKIDRAFVRDLETDPHDAAIAATIIAMGRTLGFEIVAEGVESAAQLKILQSQGCGIFQGYYFNPPLPAAKFERLWG